VTSAGERDPTVTPHQSAYFAHALTLASPAGTVEGLSRSIAGARVDLNPHQADVFHADERTFALGAKARAVFMSRMMAAVRPLN